MVGQVLGPLHRHPGPHVVHLVEAEADASAHGLDGGGHAGVPAGHRRDHDHDLGVAAGPGLGEFAACVLEEVGAADGLGVGARRGCEAQRDEG